VAGGVLGEVGVLLLGVVGVVGVVDVALGPIVVVIGIVTGILGTARGSSGYFVYSF
jgi:hypothetical protein